MNGALAFPHYGEVPHDAWPWPNFTPVEIASHGDGSLVVATAAMDLLQSLRDWLGRSLQVNSAYRDPIYNAQVGGAPRSAHKQGHAFDLALTGHDRHALYETARALGFSGFGFYRSFLHLDLGRRRQWWGPGGKARWI